jgi:hypothetical protein
VEPLFARRCDRKLSDASIPFCRNEFRYEPCGCGEFPTNSNYNGGHSNDDDNDDTWWSGASSGSVDYGMGAVNDDDKWWSGADSSGVGDDQWWSDAESSSSMATKSAGSTTGFVLGAVAFLIEILLFKSCFLDQTVVGVVPINKRI